MSPFARRSRLPAGACLRRRIRPSRSAPSAHRSGGNQRSRYAGHRQLTTARERLMTCNAAPRSPDYAAFAGVGSRRWMVDGERNQAMAGVRPMVMRARRVSRPPYARSVGCIVSFLVPVATATAVALASCAVGGASPEPSSPATSSAASSWNVTLDRPSTPPSSAHVTSSPGHPAASEPQVRTVASGENGTQVTIRFGDLLTVVPAARQQGWQVGGYPARLLRLENGAGPAASHSFVAIAVGEGQLTLTPAESGGHADLFTIRVRVLKALVQDLQP
jgi:hypothetical protein